MIKKEVKKITYYFGVYCDTCLSLITTADTEAGINKNLPVGTWRDGQKFTCPECVEKMVKNKDDEFAVMRGGSDAV